MARRKLEPGSHGEISYQELPDGRVHGTIRFRCLDGTHGRLRTRATSKAQARRTLLELVREDCDAVRVAPGGVTPDSPFIDLARGSQLIRDRQVRTFVGRPHGHSVLGIDPTRTGASHADTLAEA